MAARHIPWLWFLSAFLFAPGSVHAQRVTRPPPDSLRHIQSAIPLSGPPGTEVEIFTENLQLEARIWFGVGRVGAGFEVVSEGTQGQWGAVRGTALIPPTASWDQPLVLIVLNAVFSPVALSAPFHVTDEEGNVRRSGSFATDSARCPILRDGDGYLYYLSGAVGEVRLGDVLTVEGRYSEMSDCGEGGSIEVVRRSG